MMNMQIYLDPVPDRALDINDFFDTASVLGQVLAQRAGLGLSTEKENR